MNTCNRPCFKAAINASRLASSSAPSLSRQVISAYSAHTIFPSATFSWLRSATSVLRCGGIEVGQ